MGGGVVGEWWGSGGGVRSGAHRCSGTYLQGALVGCGGCGGYGGYAPSGGTDGLRWLRRLRTFRRHWLADECDSSPA